jgi:lipopolysaccharide transport system ATP-binding protein
MGSLTVRDLSKAYKVYPSHLARVKELLHPLGRKYHQLKWVLKDISFNVAPGEAVCVIGVNGAGKSTLLKMLTGITQPTSGTVQTHGQVSALLELGIGFHPEFTGRQNVVMAGQLLGMSVEEIRRLMPQIAAFAEIGDYMDQPLRMYSSGMQMRLAFSVATARRPDILIVDEALSVGDAYFQHKSFDRIRNFRKEGTTLFIVSHDRIAIQAICDRAILLDNGKLAKEGSPDEVLDLYNALIAERETTTIVQNKTADGRVQTISGTGEATVSDIKLLNSQGRPIEVANVGAEVTLEVKVRINANIPHFVLGYMIRDRFGQPIYGTNTYLKQLPILDLRKGEQINCRFDFAANLGPGNYSVTVALVSSDHHLDNNFEWRDLALVFEVVNFSRQQFAGCAWLDPVVRVQRQE